MSTVASENNLFRTYFCSNRAQVIETINHANELAFDVTVTNSYEEGSAPGFNVVLRSETVEIRPCPEFTLNDQIDRALGGFSQSPLIERVETSVAIAIADPRWDTHEMRMVTVWIEEALDSDHQSFSGELYLEVYDAPVPLDHDEPGLPDISPSWQRGHWMQTFTGRRFYPMDPRPEDIDIVDIAHALSMQCRYNGHVQRFMSVAEHCVLVSQVVAPELALWGLLHDATEAYVGDMIRPLKLHMPEYRAVEDRVMLAIAQRFGIDSAMPPEVKIADSRILLDERAALLGAPAGNWNVEGEPYGIEIPAWDPQTAEEQYLQRFEALTGEVMH